MSKYYLIDYENVREGGLEGADRLSAEDSIYIFYTKNANKICLDSFNNVSASIRVMKVPAGKQSLDMHIASMLGYLAGRSSDRGEYVIVSRDRDFDTVIASWNEADAGAFLKQESIAASLSAPDAPAPENAVTDQKDVPEEQAEEAKPVKKTQRKKQANQEKTVPAETQLSAADRIALNNKVVKLLRDSGLTGNLPTSVAGIVMANVKKKNAKQATYLEMIKKYGQKEGLKYYSVLKKVL